MNYESGFEAERVEPMTGSASLESDETAEATRRRRWYIGAAILALLLAIVAYFVVSGAGAEESAGGEAQLPSVTVIAPGQSTVDGEISATGTLAARRDLPVGVVGEGGRVTAISVDAGDWVRQGQVLVSIDRSVQSQQVQSAAAQVQVAQSDANIAQANLDRSLQLVERGFVSEADVDRLTATRDAAVARVRVAQAQVRELQARNARLNVVAPASGLVLERNVEIGQTVSAGSPPLFRIARGGEMEVLARLSETDLAQINVGTRATVTPVGSDSSYTGSVWQVAPLISSQDRQGTARIALPYAEGLRPGGFATVVIKSGTVSAPILPESAIQSDDEGSYVFIVDAENTVQRRNIELGQVTSEGIVIAGGLAGNERVVLRAAGFLNPGETVRPIADGA
ncbi:efflux RND transporter periplasmic adaptor subunit [Qipengyuania sp. XHP0211]|uniref:efflux RND transporter periplasmic adaptor subunit n=1 Tax=Qipengyuania sp. XHP0211 TaxID=3038079 RepID=UPI00241F39A8|nr:efflux RND transporter periplasmic adaptor subunit [Qipengyuania sp. XHP0211]MDG5752119.1 efflux RND transporter periplasmic adaptor subunit [Qipengyuania sp. XHP0211]